MKQNVFFFLFCFVGKTKATYQMLKLKTISAFEDYIILDLMAAMCFRMFVYHRSASALFSVELKTNCYNVKTDFPILEVGCQLFWKVAHIATAESCFQFSTSDDRIHPI